MDYMKKCCVDCREMDGWYCLALYRDVDDDIDPYKECMPDCPYCTYDTIQD